MRVQQDFIRRQVQQLMELVAAVVGAPRSEQRLEEVEDEVATAYGRLLNMDRTLFDLLPPRQLARELGDPERVALLAQVLLADAQLRESRDELKTAERLRQRAIVLLEAEADSPRDLPDNG